MQLVPIGRFSEMTRLSVRALRLYAEIGLLPPARIDPSSGYRYYELSQANRAEAIRILRSVDMPLDEISTLLGTPDQDAARSLLLRHRERLAQRVAAQERMLTFLETLINRKEGIMPYDVKVQQTAPQQIAATRVHTTPQRIGNDIHAGFGRLLQALARETVSPGGAPMILYHSIIDEETGGDLEISVPVDVPFSGDADVYGRELEGGPMVTTVHHGPYEEIGPAYHTITGWIAEHGHEVVGAPREVYLNDPQIVPQAELMTRVVFPIRGEPD